MNRVFRTGLVLAMMLGAGLGLATASRADDAQDVAAAVEKLRVATIAASG